MPSGSRSRRVRADDSLLCHETQALADLRQDFGELLYLARDAGAELASLIEDLDRIVPGQPVIEEQARLALARSREAASRLLGLRQQASTPGGGSLALVDELADERENMLRFLRAERAVVAGLAMAADWQSPSFAHSISPQAGSSAGSRRTATTTSATGIAMRRSTSAPTSRSWSTARRVCARC